MHGKNPSSSETLAHQVVIDMREVSRTLPFEDLEAKHKAQNHKLAWTQGWDVKPRQGKLRIFVMPHSHNDPGWIKTFDRYFREQTTNILTTVHRALLKDPLRKFIWAEISYFEWWWREQPAKVRKEFRGLLRRRQFEFVTGGWVMPDEANSNLYALETQLDEGHAWLRKTFGESSIPKYGWSIDPFGYSPTTPYLLKKRGFKGTLIQRVHYAVKTEFAKKRTLEFSWRQTWDDEGKFDLFTHLMPFYSYDVPHTCGPNPAVCCQFDFKRIGKGKTWTGCPWGQMAVAISPSNVKERAELLLDQYRKKSQLYAHNIVLAPLGDDFRYETESEAEAQFVNYRKLMTYMNEHLNVEISFGTLREYFEAVAEYNKKARKLPPILKGAFFTYADKDQDYWSGYFTSRVFDKALDRRLESTLYAADSMGAVPEEECLDAPLKGPPAESSRPKSVCTIRAARRALSLFQHHDGVTGTAKNGVVVDYAKRMSKGILSVQNWMSEHLSTRISVPNLKTCWVQCGGVRGVWKNTCQPGYQATVFNPLAVNRYWCGQTVPPKGTAQGLVCAADSRGSIVKPDLRSSKSRKSQLRFDPQTGLIVSPFVEKWMVYNVKKGGAYLFYPATAPRPYSEAVKTKHKDDKMTLRTGHWKRTVIEHPDGAVDLVFEVDLKSKNQEWFLRLNTDVKNKGVFHTDLNGFNFDRHNYRSDRTVQSQVYPMPSLASIEDDKARLTVLSEHAQGAASLHDGEIDVWMDRRLGQDDERGLSQGVQDNVKVRTTLRVLLENKGSKALDTEFEPTEQCRQHWDDLNHPLEMFSAEEGASGCDSRPRKIPNPTPRAVAVPAVVVAAENGEEGGSTQVHSALEAPPPQQHKQQEQQQQQQQQQRQLLDLGQTLWVVPAFKRAWSLELVLESLKGQKNVLVSRDADSEEMARVLARFSVDTIDHPWSCSRHPNRFPGKDDSLNANYKGDTYGNKRSPWATCLKHHWWWMMKQAWARHPGRVCVLEDDTVVHPATFEWLASQSNAKSVKLEAKAIPAVPWCMSSEQWRRIEPTAFCEHDDYNWDQTIAWMMEHGHGPNEAVVPNPTLSMHVGDCGGWDAGGRNKKCSTGQLAAIRARVAQWRASKVTVTARKAKWLVAHGKPNGGWGPPRDHAHCLSGE